MVKENADLEFRPKNRWKKKLSLRRNETMIWQAKSIKRHIELWIT